MGGVEEYLVVYPSLILCTVESKFQTPYTHPDIETTRSIFRHVCFLI